jgi:hypothetical protein
MKMKRIALVCSVIALGASSAAFAYNYNLSTYINQFNRTDLRNGGSLTQQSNPRNIEFKIQDRSASRSELRRKEQRSGTRTIAGTFILKDHDSSTTKHSIIQVLTVTDSNVNARSGSAKPAAQLAFRKVSNGTFDFYIVQQSGQPRCSFGTFRKNQKVGISMTYKAGAQPVFRIGGKTCVNNESINTGNNNPGLGQNRFYYGKLGVYATGSGDGKATVVWENVHDGYRGG